MQSESQDLQRADRVIWIVIAAVAGAVLLSSVYGSFHIGWTSFRAVAVLSLVCLAGARFYTARKDARAASALLCTAQIALFPAVAAPLSYVAASAGRPLWDGTFASWDHALGLDWMALLTTMNTHPGLHSIFAAAYSSFMFQTATVVLALALTRHLLHLRLYILSFFLAVLVTIAISVILPAQGVWGHLHLSAENYPAITPVTREAHLKIFHGLRDGTFRDLLAQGSDGIITFPSLHTAGALLFIFAMWPVRILRWIGASLNVAMIAATPVDGGHYFSDVIAGGAVAILCWLIAARILRASSARPAHVEEILRSPPMVPDLIPQPPETTLARKVEPAMDPLAQA